MPKLTFRVDSLQWEDAHWYDKEIDDMVPLFDLGEVIQVQLYTLSYEIIKWMEIEAKPKGNYVSTKGFFQSDTDDSNYNISGVVKKIYKEKGEKNYKRTPNLKIWEALIDCNLPILIHSYSQDTERIPIPVSKGHTVECITPVWGAISFFKGKFFSPIAGKVLYIENKKRYYTPGWLKEEKKLTATGREYYIHMTIDTSVSEPIAHRVDHI
jgi:hypothetical protein